MTHTHKTVAIRRDNSKGLPALQVDVTSLAVAVLTSKQIGSHVAPDFFTTIDGTEAEGDLYIASDESLINTAGIDLVLGFAVSPYTAGGTFNRYCAWPKIMGGIAYTLDIETAIEIAKRELELQCAILV